MAAFNPNPRPGVPTPADLIEEMGSVAAETYGRIELELMRKLAKATSKGVDTYRHNWAERLRIASDLRTASQELVASVDNAALARDIMALAASEGDEAAVARLGLLPNGGPTSTMQRSFIVASTASKARVLQGALDRMLATLPDQMTQTYMTTIARVAALQANGLSTPQLAQREATKQLLESGLPYVRYKNGAQMPMGSYAEMAVRTATNNAYQDAHIARIESSPFGGLFQIIIGVGACKSCASNAGKVFSNDGRAGTFEFQSAFGEETVTVTIAGSLAEAQQASHFRGPNCRCQLAAYFPGAERVAGISTYDPKAEKNRTQLRSLERRKRAALLSADLAPDDIARKQAEARVKALNARIREHVAETGMPRQRFRERLSFTNPKVAS